MSGVQETLASARKSGPFYLGTIGMLRLFLLIYRQRARDKWTPDHLKEYQQRALNELRDFAYSRSPFYRRFHEGLFNAPLEQLPVLTKAELMKNWDQVVTDRGVRLSEVRDFISRGDWSGKFKGRYYVNMTSGTTGMNGIFIYDSKEWVNAVGSAVRMHDWCGDPVGLTKTVKHAFITTVHPWHSTAALGASVQGRFFPAIRIDSTEPIDDAAAKLNAFQPEFLATYPSFAKQLAHLQTEGKLNISPKVVCTTSEVLSTDIREIISKTWGAEVFDNYGGTEGAVMATECTEHRGIHLQGDRLIAEFVDENNQPIEPGQYSSKVLITVLTSRALPLIRYEMGDSVRLSKNPCPCGRPYPLIEHIQGRFTEVVHLAGKSGASVTIQPLFLHETMEKVSAKGWQIAQTGKSNLRVSILNPGDSFDEESLRHELVDRLLMRGVWEPLVEVDYPSVLKRNAIGKVILIKAMEQPEPLSIPASHH